jgi:transposase
MQHYVGLDVSVKETSVCIVDKAGRVVREVKVATKPAAILAVLTEEALAIERIGLEAGPLSQWLYSALTEAGLPVDPIMGGPKCRSRREASTLRVNIPHQIDGEV